MKKLTADEILAIVEKYFTLEQFAYSDYVHSGKINDEDFKFSDEYKALSNDLAVATLNYNNYSRNATELQRLGDDSYSEVSSEYSRLFSLKHHMRRKEIMSSIGLGEIEEVENSEGDYDSSEFSSVKHFKDHGVYIKVTGTYQGEDEETEFNEGYGYEVQPEKREITVYVRKKPQLDGISQEQFLHVQPS